jgi:phospholipase D1/2
MASSHLHLPGHGHPTVPSPPVPALHGSLSLRILSARNLSAAADSTISSMLSRMLTDASDTFVEVTAGPRSLIKTSTAIGGGAAPVWPDAFMRLDVCEDVPVLTATVYAAAGVQIGRMVKPRSLGVCDIDVAFLIQTGKLSGELELVSKHRKSRAGFLTVEIVFTPVGGTMGYEVPNTYFPMRTSCMLSSFQDACVPPGSLPQIVDGNGLDYAQRSCWSEMYAAIVGAEKLVYISGWSVVSSLVMVRDSNIPVLPLGDLLVKKANEGCTVSVLIWDELGSVNGAVLKSDGLMGTSDEQTYTFFKPTKVHCEKLSRCDDGTNGLLGGWQTSGLWSHHGKYVIVDRECPSDLTKRRLTCYLGGLDLASGRYDTPQHSLFRTLQTVHADDYHQACTLGTSPSTGPREPWHDVHCCIEGAVVWDVVRTFEDRWRRQAPGTAMAALAPTVSGAVSMFVTPDAERAIIDKMPDRFNIQVIRSIDDRSCLFDPAQGSNELSFKKGRQVDAGILAAYVHHIRRAERFIYIENQYFQGGSAQLWADPSNISDNIVPCEIVKKICSKIRARLPFAVYILMPLMPEGTNVAAVSEVLRWQARTAEGMYRKIGACIRDAGLVGVVLPTDYLTYFCLGNRESESGSQGTAAPPTNTTAFAAWSARRHQIYVHSKYACFDDVVHIIGSANIKYVYAATLHQTRARSSFVLTLEAFDGPSLRLLCLFQITVTDRWRRYATRKSLLSHINPLIPTALQVHTRHEEPYIAFGCLYGLSTWE